MYLYYLLVKLGFIMIQVTRHLQISYRLKLNKLWQFAVSHNIAGVIQPACLPVGGANASTRRRHRLLGMQAHFFKY